MCCGLICVCVRGKSVSIHVLMLARHLCVHTEKPHRSRGMYSLQVSAYICIFSPEPPRILSTCVSFHRCMQHFPHMLLGQYLYYKRCMLIFFFFSVNAQLHTCVFNFLMVPQPPPSSDHRKWRGCRQVVYPCWSQEHQPVVCMKGMKDEQVGP